jgi:DNA-directed RNA polymerase specialized sigma24 family protein
MKPEVGFLPEQQGKIFLADRFDTVKDFFRMGGEGYKIILNRLRNPHDAEEAVQNIVAHLWECRSEIQVTETTLLGYLSKTAVHAAFGEKRKRDARGYGRNVPADGKTQLASKDRGVEMVEALHDREKIREAIEYVLLRIPKHYADLLRLHYLQGISKAGLIGRAQGSDGKPYTKLSTINVTLQRARHIFKKKFNQVKSEIIDLEKISKSVLSLLELTDVDN